MTEVEGKLSIWIKDGKFTHASDLYVIVMIDDNNVSFSNFLFDLIQIFISSQSFY